MITRKWWNDTDRWLNEFGIGRPAMDVVLEVLRSERYQAMTLDEKLALNLLIVSKVNTGK